ncbi:hypothetical protein C4588_01070 [Candidatus Parcubacteria bacterium]|nr:MAG: hypothetical protein C4588_01070 [Candidatus Parcubacteria bacterium]
MEHSSAGFDSHFISDFATSITTFRRILTIARPHSVIFQQHLMRRDPEKLMEHFRVAYELVPYVGFHCFPQLELRRSSANDHLVFKDKSGQFITMSEGLRVFRPEAYQVMRTQLQEWAIPLPWRFAYADSVYCDPTNWQHQKDYFSNKECYRDVLCTPVHALWNTFPQLQYLEGVVDEFPEVLQYYRFGRTLDFKPDLSWRDNVTNMFNRFSFEEERKRWGGAIHRLAWIPIAAGTWFPRNEDIVWAERQFRNWSKTWQYQPDRLAYIPKNGGGDFD